MVTSAIQVICYARSSIDRFTRNNGALVQARFVVRGIADLFVEGRISDNTVYHLIVTLMPHHPGWRTIWTLSGSMPLIQCFVLRSAKAERSV